MTLPLGARRGPSCSESGLSHDAPLVSAVPRSRDPSSRVSSVHVCDDLFGRRRNLRHRARGNYLLKNIHWAEAIAKTFRPLYQLSFNKFYFDEIYSRYIIRPFNAVGAIFFKFDASIIDGAVNGAGTGSLWIGAVKNWIDQHIVDGLVNFMGTFTRLLNSIVKRLQTGFVQNYLLIAFLSFLVFIIWELKLI